MRTVAEALMRRGRLQGDPIFATTQASASMRADNLRRAGSGQRARFRFASGGRCSPLSGPGRSEASSFGSSRT